MVPLAEGDPAGSSTARVSPDTVRSTQQVGSHDTTPPIITPVHQVVAIEQCSQTMAKYPSAVDVQHFFQHMPIVAWRQARTHLGGRRGITWLELYIAYRLAGNP